MKSTFSFMQLCGGSKQFIWWGFSQSVKQQNQKGSKGERMETQVEYPLSCLGQQMPLPGLPPASQGLQHESHVLGLLFLLFKELTQLLLSQKELGRHLALSVPCRTVLPNHVAAQASAHLFQTCLGPCGAVSVFHVGISTGRQCLWGLLLAGLIVQASQGTIKMFHRTTYGPKFHQVCF